MNSQAEETRERLVREHLARERLSQESLTNEALRAKFTSQFDLVNYAIRLAENMIEGGQLTAIENQDLTIIVKVLNELRRETKDNGIESLSSARN